MIENLENNDKLPFISCICPTYKRPELLKNAVACFIAQDYPTDRCELIIFDDANQFDEQSAGNWRLLSSATRFASLPDKFNLMLEQAQGEIIAVWEDDDIFLPSNLMDVAHCHIKYDSGYYASKNVWWTHAQEFGKAALVDATSRFHSSWRFTRQLIDSIGGYPQTTELSFDQQLRSLLLNASSEINFYGEAENPSYVYRWGNGYWHGSQGGDGKGYENLWEYVGSLPAPYQGELIPAFDEETLKIVQFLSVE